MIPDIPIDIRIRLAEFKFFCCFLTLLIFYHVGLLSVAENSQQGGELAKSGSNKKNFNSANIILVSIGKSGIVKFEFHTT